MNTMFSLLTLKSNIVEKPNAEEIKVNDKDVTIKVSYTHYTRRFIIEIQFENVTFGYLPEKNILKNLTIEIPTGKKVAIVGGSGSG